MVAVAGCTENKSVRRHRGRPRRCGSERGRRGYPRDGSRCRGGRGRRRERQKVSSDYGSDRRAGRAGRPTGPGDLVEVAKEASGGEHRLSALDPLARGPRAMPAIRSSPGSTRPPDSRSRTAPPAGEKDQPDDNTRAVLEAMLQDHGLAGVAGRRRRPAVRARPPMSTARAQRWRQADKVHLDCRIAAARQAGGYPCPQTPAWYTRPIPTATPTRRVRPTASLRAATRPGRRLSL